MGSSASTLNETLRIKIGHETSEQDGGKKQERYNRVKTSKYTIFTFVPLTILGQFARIANLYFLLITIITIFLSGISNATSTLIPLLVVILLNMLQQFREDLTRHQQDELVNHSIVTVIRNGVQVETESQFIAPGDLVVIKEDTDVPCDLILLQTTDPNGKCFVMTSNLDGETNLKALYIPRGLPQVKIDELHNLGVIECEDSKTDLYTFQGKIELNNGAADVKLNADNLLLRGSRVKNTECVIGSAIYLGMKTKLQLNSRLVSHKRPQSEWYLNIYLLILVIFMILFVTLLYFLQRYDEISLIPKMAYMGPPIDVNTGYAFFVEYFSLLVLFNYMIPISLYGTLAIYRVMGAFFMRWDLEMYDEDIDEPCIVRTAALNEELGQIDILFSDKTGTLTKNEMVFQQCSIRGQKYLYQKTQLLNVDLNTTHDINFFNRDQRKFFEALAICHTVHVAAEKGLKTGAAAAASENINFRTSMSPQSPDVVLDVAETLAGNVSPVKSPQQVLMRAESIERQQEIDDIVLSLDYQAASSDEKALVEACARLGLVYLGDDQDIMKMRVLPPHNGGARPYSIGETKGVAYERLHVLEFTPERKRMSVIVRDRQGAKWIYTKGADSSIFPLCTASSNELIVKTAEHIDEFASSGLRTLAIARKQLKESDYLRFVQGLNAASSSLDQRQELLDQCHAIVEQDLELLGATAVEDMLQEDVAATLESLRAADIKLWVLTGDKVETALSIALSCGHLPLDATRIVMSNCQNKQQILEHLDNAQRTLDAGHNCALLVDGTSLGIILEEVSTEFRDVAIKCQAVLCCRLSPLQKSQVVSLVRSSRDKYTTAAIGDGANDVSMIQEAHVGIGIIGKEGRQAVMSADYSIAQFRFVKKLLLVHGHYNTVRQARMVLFYFYENIVVSMCMFFFQFYAMHSGANLYDSLFLALYTTVYNGVSIVVISFMEKPYSEETLMSKPELYNQCRKYKPLQWYNMGTWVLLGLYHSVVIYFFTHILFMQNNVILNVGQTAGIAVFGTVIIQCIVLTVNLKQWLELNYVTRCYLRTFAWVILVFVISTVIHNVINYVDDPAFYWAYNYVLSSIPLWLFLIVTVIACLLPDYLLRFIREGFRSKERWWLLEKRCCSRSQDSYDTFTQSTQV